MIDRIQASGQTNIYPALAIAFRWLQNAESKSRHVILLSDGDTAPADFERQVRRMVEAHISVSTVAIGREADRELMANIARWGKGRAYYAEDPSNVPQIFVEDTQNVSRATLIEEPFRPVVKHKIEALHGIDFAHAPMLRGFASTKARDAAEVFLESASGAPIPGSMQYGLGRTMVFASDVKNRWAADWLQWDGYGKLWGQLVRDVMRRDSREELPFSVRREGTDARVTLDALTPAGGWQNRLAPAVRVVRPGGAVATLRLRQTAPGAYSASRDGQRGRRALRLRTRAWWRDHRRSHAGPGCSGFYPFPMSIAAGRPTPGCCLLAGRPAGSWHRKPTDLRGWERRGTFPTHAVAFAAAAAARLSPRHRGAPRTTDTTLARRRLNRERSKHVAPRVCLD